MLIDDEISEEERKFNDAIKEALGQGRIPIECIEEIEISDDFYVKTVVMKEC